MAVANSLQSGAGGVAAVPGVVQAGSSTPTAQANAANSTTPVKASTAPNSAPATQIFGSDTVINANTANPTITPSAATSASTTTQSNSNKQSQVSGIQTTTNQLANGSGVSTNANGTTTYANGTVYDPNQPLSSSNVPQGETYNSATGGATYTGNIAQSAVVDANGATTSGGYSGDTYYAPGQVLPKDQNGNPIPLTASSPTHDLIMSNLNSAKSQADALTATIIDNIQSSYANLIKQQQIVNSSQAAGANGNRLVGGVTGQGSTAQYASQTSNSVFTSVLNQGIQAIGNLQAQENDAIIKAQQAGQQEDFQLMDKMNTEAQNIQTTKQNAANAINATIQAQAQKLQDEQVQQTKDSFVASQLQSGVTDPNAILKAAKDAGLTITADEVGKSMSALSPDKAQIESLAAEAASAGADAATVAKITGATNFNEAIKLATPALGAKVAADKAQQIFDNKIKQQQVNISQEDANTNYQHLLLDKQNAASATVNASNDVINASVQSNIPLPNGKTALWINGDNLKDPKAMATALNNGQVVLTGASAAGMQGVQNAMGQVNDLLSSLKTAGVDLTKTIPSTAGGSSSNQGATSGFLRTYAAGTATPALQNFADSLKGTGTSGTNSIINELAKYPNTGNLVSTLRNNIPDKSDSATDMNNKITNITNALIATGNSYLSTGAIPKGSPPTGQIWVQDNSTGQWGSIPPNEFDSTKYTQIP